MWAAPLIDMLLADRTMSSHVPAQELCRPRSFRVLYASHECCPAGAAAGENVITDVDAPDHSLPLGVFRKKCDDIRSLLVGSPRRSS